MPINKYDEPRQFVPTCALDRCTAIHPHVSLYHIDFGDLHFYMCKPHALIAGTLGIASMANEEDDDLVRCVINDLAEGMEEDVRDWDMPPVATQGFSVSNGLATEFINSGIGGQAVDLGEGLVGISINREDLPFGANDPLTWVKGDEDDPHFSMPHPSDEQIENDHR